MAPLTKHPDIPVLTRHGEQRVGHIIRPWDGTPQAFVIIGAPDDQGVTIAQGRAGAKLGPDAIRKELYSMTLGAHGELENAPISDAGNLKVSTDQEDNYQNLADLVASVIRAGSMPIVLGGGHDLSYGGLSGFLKTHPRGSVINVDPHFDARPIETDGRSSSGVAFYRLLEEGKLKAGGYTCFGYQTERNTAERYAYLKKKKSQLISSDALMKENLKSLWKRELGRIQKQAFALSFDVDSLDAAHAPGVSALNAHGLTAREAVMLITEAARSRKLAYLDFMETNPACDPIGHTARLVALLIHHFLRIRIP